MSDRRPLTPRQRLARVRRRRMPPGVDVLWQRGEAGWHAAPAGLANESDARLLRALAADAWRARVLGHAAKYPRHIGAASRRYR